jgi:hypothetical protein
VQGGKNNGDFFAKTVAQKKNNTGLAKSKNIM